MSRPIRFGEDFAPDEEWGRQWTTLFRERVPSYLTVYRERVHRYHDDQASRAPSYFRLKGPVEVRAIATLLAVWVFSRPASVDSVQVVEAWEDSVVADWDFKDLPKDRALAMIRDRFELSDDWELIDTQSITGHILPGIVGAGFDAEQARSAADWHAARAKYAPIFAGEELDHEALERAQRRFDEIQSLTPQQRGQQLDYLVADVLRAHGCEVDVGGFGGPEQIDVFVYSPAYALAACRWQVEPLDRAAIDVLIRRVEHRPPSVSGLYISMSGFSEPACEEARQCNSRAIYLADREEFHDLLTGRVHFTRFWDMKVRDRLRES